MYMSPGAGNILACLNVDPSQVTDDPTGVVLAQVSNDVARHNSALVKARTKLREILDPDSVDAPLSTCTAVRDHDGAWHALDALNPTLHAAVDAWKTAHPTTTN